MSKKEEVLRGNSKSFTIKNEGDLQGLQAAGNNLKEVIIDKNMKLQFPEVVLLLCSLNLSCLCFELPILPPKAYYRKNLEDLKKCLEGALVIKGMFHENEELRLPSRGDGWTPTVNIHVYTRTMLTLLTHFEPTGSMNLIIEFEPEEDMRLPSNVKLATTPTELLYPTLSDGSLDLSYVKVEHQQVNVILAASKSLTNETKLHTLDVSSLQRQHVWSHLLLKHLECIMTSGGTVRMKGLPELSPSEVQRLTKANIHIHTSSPFKKRVCSKTAEHGGAFDAFTANNLAEHGGAFDAFTANNLSQLPLEILMEVLEYCFGKESVKLEIFPCQKRRKSFIFSQNSKVVLLLTACKAWYQMLISEKKVEILRTVESIQKTCSNCSVRSSLTCSYCINLPGVLRQAKTSQYNSMTQEMFNLLRSIGFLKEAWNGENVVDDNVRREMKEMVYMYLNIEKSSNPEPKKCQKKKRTISKMSGKSSHGSISKQVKMLPEDELSTKARNKAWRQQTNTRNVKIQNIKCLDNLVGAAQALNLTLNLSLMEGRVQTKENQTISSMEWRDLVSKLKQYHGEVETAFKGNNVRDGLMVDVSPLKIESSSVTVICCPQQHDRGCIDKSPLYAFDKTKNDKHTEDAGNESGEGTFRQGFARKNRLGEQDHEAERYEQGKTMIEEYGRANMGFTRKNRLGEQDHGRGFPWVLNALNEENEISISTPVEPAYTNWKNLQKKFECSQDPAEKEALLMQMRDIIVLS